MKTAITFAVFSCIAQCFGSEPSEIGEPVELSEQPECVVRIVKVSDVYKGFPGLGDSGLVSNFLRSVEIQIENQSTSEISFRGMDAKESPVLMHRIQVWNDNTESWPPLLDFGVFESRARNFALAPQGKRKFSISFPAMMNSDLTEPIPQRFRIAVFLSDRNGSRTVAYTEPVNISGANKPSRSSPDRTESK